MLLLFIFFDFFDKIGILWLIYFLDVRLNILEQRVNLKLANDIAQHIDINQELFDAFCKIPRSEFVYIKKFAYSLNPQPILANQWISSPITVAQMTMALDLEGVDKILEIGCGSGYQAAILSKIVRRVFSIERIRSLYDEAKMHFQNLNISNVYVSYDDGLNGWKTYAPYERILFSAAIDKVPQNIFEQLDIGGILVAPIQFKNCQNIVKFTKIDTFNIKEEILKECNFVPIISGLE